jgi:hypothetical protein
VTLIAAFRYQFGFVLVSDSQETHNYPSEVAGGPPREYRVKMDKVKPQRAGDYEVVGGGAGDDGHAIDMFERRLYREVANWQDGPLSDLETENRLISFCSGYIVQRPEPIEFLLCLKHKDARSVTCWRIDDDVVNPVDKYELIGWDEAIYKHEVDWLFRPGSWLNHAVLMGIRLFTMGEATSNTIKGPFQVVVVDQEKGALSYPPETISELQRRVVPFNMALASVILNASDMTIHDAGFIESLGVFEDEILNLRAQFLGRPVLRPYTKEEIEKYNSETKE